jgi:hypothetical protein
MDRPKRRSLLVASVGIATVSYVLACGKQQPVSGNLPAPEPTQSTPPVTGNLPAPPPMDAAATPTTTSTAPTPPTSASATPDAGKTAPKK